MISELCEFIHLKKNKQGTWGTITIIEFLTTLVCKLNFFIYTKFHTEVQPNLTKLVCKILMWLYLFFTRIFLCFWFDFGLSLDPKDSTVQKMLHFLPQVHCEWQPALQGWTIYELNTHIKQIYLGKLPANLEWKETINSTFLCYLEVPQDGFHLL